MRRCGWLGVEPEPLGAQTLAEALEAAYKEGKHDALHPKKRPVVTSGWTSPDPKEFAKFWEMVEHLAEVKFGKDVDGDCPVRVYMNDLTRFESAWWGPIPHTFTDDEFHPYGNQLWNAKDHTPEEELARERAIRQNFLERLRWTQYHVEDAKHAMERFHRKLESDIRKQDEAPPKRVEARLKKLEVLKEKWADPVKFYTKNGYVVDPKSMTYTYTPEYGKNAGKTINYTIGNKPENFDALMQELVQLKKWKYPAPLKWDEIPRVE